MKVAIYGRAISESYYPVYDKIISKLLDFGWSVSFYHELWNVVRKQFPRVKDAETFTNHEEIAGNKDFVFSIGGDGTILNTITLVRDSGIPVLGFNTGRLGFLSLVNLNDIDIALKSLESGNYEKEERSLICLDTKERLFGDENFALNEVCLHRREVLSMISIHAYVNDVFLNTYWADGVIVATPTGSTAYSLSCGGPIVTPDSQNFIISPVSSHNLTVRPIVVPDKSVIRLKATGRKDRFLVSLDSRTETIGPDTELVIRKHPYTICLIKFHGTDFFTTIREKLAWGMDKRN